MSIDYESYNRLFSGRIIPYSKALKELTGINASAVIMLQTIIEYDGLSEEIKSGEIKFLDKETNYSIANMVFNDSFFGTELAYTDKEVRAARNHLKLKRLIKTKNLGEKIHYTINYKLLNELIKN